MILLGEEQDIEDWLNLFFDMEDAVKALDLELATWWAELEYAKL